MAETTQEKLCPMLRDPCVRDNCRMWLKVTITGRDKAGNPVSANPPEQCALVWAGMLGLKGLQFPGVAP
jgi:hypothetical protein